MDSEEIAKWGAGGLGFGWLLRELIARIWNRTERDSEHATKALLSHREQIEDLKSEVRELKTIIGLMRETGSFLSPRLTTNPGIQPTAETMPGLTRLREDNERQSHKSNDRSE